MVCGDVMSHMPVTNDAWDDVAQKYDYKPIMAGAAQWVAGADYAVANLETTLSGGPPYSGYPAFNSPDELAYDLKELGFDLVLTANNHCMDRGVKGVYRTLDVLDQAGLAHIGTSRTQAEQDDNIVVADVGGISVAFLGYTYGTNGIPVPKDQDYAVNRFNTDYLTNLTTPDTERLLADLERAVAKGTDLVCVMIHWGVEYQTKENGYQEQIADLLIANGADLVLGGHPHVLQPMETRTVTTAAGESREGFVCYSLGNFISSQVAPLTDTTAVLTLELTRDNVTGETTVSGCEYRPMYMLRQDGSSRRFQLLDAHAELAAGTWEAAVLDRLQQAVDTCHDILGEDQDAGAAVSSG